jgi:hypothetical protein
MEELAANDSQIETESVDGKMPSFCAWNFFLKQSCYRETTI